MTAGDFTYVVTSYRDPPQVARLVDTLRRLAPDARVVVSHDRKAAPLDSTMVDAPIIPTPEPINWGDGTYLRSILAVLDGLSLGPRSWVTILTAQDYPLRPLVDYQRHLGSCAADALLEPMCHSADWAPLIERTRQRQVRLPRWTASRGRYGRVLDRLPGATFSPQPHGLSPTLDVRRLRTPFGEGLVPARGSDLWAANGRAVRQLLDEPRLLRYFERTPIPSESYPHTVLRNAANINVRDEMIHFADFVNAAHPEWLSLDDLPRLEQSGRWFARKFEKGSPALDLLDARIGL